MSLNNYQLNPEAVQNLFNDYIYIIPEKSSDLIIKKQSDLPSAPAIPKISQEPIEVKKEENKPLKDIKKDDSFNLKELKKELSSTKIFKRAIIIINEEDATNELKTFLFKILQAVKLSESDIHLHIHPNGSTVDLNGVLKDYSSSKVLSFGTHISPEYKTELNKETIYTKETKLFQTFSLKELISDTEKKKILWGNLQIIFPAK
ncbi:hypothetical protein MYP_4930 [Sporocytophaga myxococcoides]|uniref:Uncharacterized protein n=1 Tax=Sporocytophaga myxococcoides TaxID=153721 RepID=A0A098LMF1_9BACT|nr:hypothetical protein [Sporocytophaga myxococcoides]GAL87699.1 hypothetical protein MYP_4930 [Sporocytophaga myxococcoides]